MVIGMHEQQREFIKLRRRLFFILLLLAVSVALIPLSTAADYDTGARLKIPQLGAELKRGVSSKADVHRLLGAPKGFGEALLPPEHIMHQVWYYEDIKLLDMKTDDSGVLRGKMRQQVVLIFFAGDSFAGYMWFTNAQQVGD